MFSFEIKKIRPEQTLELRSSIMKPYLRPDQCVNPGDQDPLTFHLGAMGPNDQLMGIATFLPDPHPFFPSSHHPYRLRGMASLPEVQRQGVGRALVQEGEKILASRGADLLWFNAREKAFAFYLALGFEMTGEFFELDRIGPHKVMFKNLIRP